MAVYTPDGVPGKAETPPAHPWPYPGMRPAATPTAAGLTPGWQHLVDEDRLVTRAELRAALRAMLARVVHLERVVARGRSL